MNMYVLLQYFSLENETVLYFFKEWLSNLPASYLASTMLAIVVYFAWSALLWMGKRKKEVTKLATTNSIQWIDAVSLKKDDPRTPLMINMLQKEGQRFVLVETDQQVTRKTKSKER